MGHEISESPEEAPHKPHKPQASRRRGTSREMIATTAERGLLSLYRENGLCTAFLLILFHSIKSSKGELSETALPEKRRPPCLTSARRGRGSEDPSHGCLRVARRFSLRASTFLGPPVAYICHVLFHDRSLAQESADFLLTYCYLPSA